MLSALRIEARALRQPGMVPVRVGVGRRSAEKALARLKREPSRRTVVAGFGGALDDGLAPGDVVVANEVQGPDGRFSCAHEDVYAALSEAGLAPVLAAIATRDHIVRGAERNEVAAEGARVVEMESYWLRPLAEAADFSVVRVVVDTPSRELGHPLHTLTGGVRAHAALRRVGAGLSRMHACRRQSG
ncbi:MAG: hypothetical protein AB8I08_04460 [Sandaracinaceae bacterium]